MLLAHELEKVRHVFPLQGGLFRLIRLCVTKFLGVVYSLVNLPQGVATNFDRHRAAEHGFHSDRVRPFDLSKDRA